MKTFINHTVVISCALLFLFNHTYAQESITISGNVLSLPFEVNPPTQVIAFNESTSEEMASTYTDENGDFELNLTTTGIEEINHFEARVYPNPFKDEVNIEFHALESGKHFLDVYNIQGMKVLSQSMELSAYDKAVFEIDGFVNAGMYLVHIRSNNFAQTLPVLQMGGGGSNKISSYHIGSASTKSQTLNDFDIALKILSDSHEEKDTLLTWQNYFDLNIILYQIPEQSQTEISLQIYNDVFGYGLVDALIEIKDFDTQELLISETTVNNIYTCVLNYLYWEYEELSYQTLNNIFIEAIKGHHVHYIYTIAIADYGFENVLEQIPENKIANITGTVINQLEEFIDDTLVY